MVAMGAAACGGSDANERYLPRTIVHENAGRSFPSGPCASWLSPGIDAAFCATGAEVPSNDQPGVGQIEFTGTPRAGTEGEIAQAAGALPEGRPIGIKINTSTEGTIVAQGICGRTLVRATFLRVRFIAGDRARLDVTQIGDTPVILMRHNGRTLPPRREVLVDLGWMSLLGPGGCAFRVS
jgi:hypothetical protein